MVSNPKLKNTKFKYMYRALQIAFDRWGLTSPNPPVGAVIVKNNKIISEGGTQAAGGDHAEIVAIKKSKVDLRGAEIYISLEPCSHFGKTPPCTEEIIKAGFKKVYFPLLDPNPKVSGAGLKKLKKAKIQVEIIKELETEAKDLIRPFKKYILEGKPYCLHKTAFSLDGRIATLAGDSKWISSPLSRYIVHKLRAKVDAVIIGKNTFEKDKPLLNVRLNQLATETKKNIGKKISLLGYKNFVLESLLNHKIKSYQDPLRIIVGLPQNLNPQDNFWRDQNHLIMVPIQDLTNKKNLSLAKINIQPLRMKSLAGQIEEILKILHQRGIMTLLLEGGSKLAGSFFDNKSIDQFLYFIAPLIIGNGLSPLESKKQKNKIIDSLKLHDISKALIGEDLLYNAYK
jgi:diaminohydroxyphosphoribosylaminopyrimidine deaminase/5-amino-6-(5-phosphoribosylamino)uracil reductase